MSDITQENMRDVIIQLRERHAQINTHLQEAIRLEKQLTKHTLLIEKLQLLPISLASELSGKTITTLRAWVTDGRLTGRLPDGSPLTHQAIGHVYIDMIELYQLLDQNL